MPSSNPVDWPVSWRGTVERRHYFSLAAIVVFLISVPITIAVYFRQEGMTTASRYVFAFALMNLFLAYTGYHIRLKRRKNGSLPLVNQRLEGEGSALCIPYSGNIFAGFMLMYVAMTAIFAMAAIDAVWFYTDEGGAISGAVIFGLVALAFSSLPILMALGKFARGWILLSQSGISQRGWTFSSFLPWDSIVAVHPYYTDGPCILVLAEDDAPWQRHQILKIWKADRLPRKLRDDGQGPQPMIDIRAQFLAVDPALVLHILAYYAKNPNARVELGTEAALRRAKSGAFGGHSGYGGGDTSNAFT